MFVGLVKPLEDGDNGTPRTVLAEGDLESKSDLRERWGVPLVYRLRALCDAAGFGRPDERDDAIPGEVLLI